MGVNPRPDAEEEAYDGLCVAAYMDPPLYMDPPSACSISLALLSLLRFVALIGRAPAPLPHRERPTDTALNPTPPQKKNDRQKRSRDY